MVLLLEIMQKFLRTDGQFWRAIPLLAIAAAYVAWLGVTFARTDIDAAAMCVLTIADIAMTHCLPLVAR